ncbi:TPA: hypothetical protein DCX16_05505, partial [bacterium]|nr:hypothetical protein [bacterium]
DTKEDIKNEAKQVLEDEEIIIPQYTNTDTTKEDIEYKTMPSQHINIDTKEPIKYETTQTLEDEKIITYPDVHKDTIQEDRVDDSRPKINNIKTTAYSDGYRGTIQGEGKPEDRKDIRVDDRKAIDDNKKDLEVILKENIGKIKDKKQESAELKRSVEDRQVIDDSKKDLGAVSKGKIDGMKNKAMDISIIHDGKQKVEQATPQRQEGQNVNIEKIKQGSIQTQELGQQFKEGQRNENTESKINIKEDQVQIKQPQFLIQTSNNEKDTPSGETSVRIAKVASVETPLKKPYDNLFTKIEKDIFLVKGYSSDVKIDEEALKDEGKEGNEQKEKSFERSNIIKQEEQKQNHEISKIEEPLINNKANLYQFEARKDIAKEKPGQGIREKHPLVFFEKTSSQSLQDVPKVQNQSSQNSSLSFAKKIYEIVQQAELNLKNDHVEMNISLKPEYLGKLNMKLTLTESILNTKFIVANSHLKELIEVNLHSLRDAFSSLDIIVGNIEVSIENGFLKGRHLWERTETESHAMQNVFIEDNTSHEAFLDDEKLVRLYWQQAQFEFTA